MIVGKLANIGIDVKDPDKPRAPKDDLSTAVA